MKKCPECSSEKIVKDAILKSMGEHYATVPVSAVVYGDPDALILKQAVKSEIRIEVCGDCGFIQAYAMDPRQLWATYQSRQSGVE